MTKEELLEWFELLKQEQNGYYVSDWDKQTLTRLNHIVMEEAHRIHNNNMMKGEK